MTRLTSSCGNGARPEEYLKAYAAVLAVGPQDTYLSHDWAASLGCLGFMGEAQEARRNFGQPEAK